MLSSQDQQDGVQHDYDAIIKKATTMPGGVALLPRIHQGISYPTTFMGKDLVKWLKGNQFTTTEPESVQLCQELQNE